MLQKKLRDSEINCSQIRVERDKLLKVSSDLKIKVHQNEKRSELSVAYSPREELHSQQLSDSMQQTSEITILKNEVESLRKTLINQIQHQ